MPIHPLGKESIMRVNRPIGRTAMRWLPALLAVAFGTGCSDLTGPNLEGVYHLENFAGSPLPSTVTFQGGSMTVHSAELHLRGRQRFDLSMERDFCTSPTECERETVTETGMYSLAGGLFVLLMDRQGRYDERSRIDGHVETDQIILYDFPPGSVWVKR
jgi:hypothetical protein